MPTTDSSDGPVEMKEAQIAYIDSGGGGSGALSYRGRANPCDAFFVRIRTMLTAAVLIIGTVAPASAQVISTEPQASGSQTWTVSLGPYFWLPTVRSNLNYTTPRGFNVTQHISEGIGDYLSDINFGAFLGGEARYGRYAVMTDGFFTSLSMTNNKSRLGAINPGTGPINIPVQQQLRTGSRANMGVWSLAGSYTMIQENWGNIDVVVGMRMLAIGSKLNYTLSNDILLPNRTVALSRDGSFGVGGNFWDGVAGVRGRINIPNSNFYVPFYFDIGSGGMPLTWQAYIAVAYRTKIADISIGYRYLDFEQNDNKAIRNLSLGGALVAANFKF